MSARPFRFGVVSAMARSGAEWLTSARQIEELGYATMLVPDRLGPLVAAIPAVAAAAVATTRLRVGTFVLAAGWRNPTVLAHEVQTLGLLSGGRFELGLGGGTSEEEYRKAGIAFERPAERVAYVANAIELVRAELGAAAPPILVAAGGPRMLALAGRAADTVAIGTGRDLSEPVLAGAIEQVRRAGDPELSINLVAVVAPGHELAPWVRERVRGIFGVEVEGLVAAKSPYVLTGRSDEMAEQLIRLRERLGISYVTLPQDPMAAFAPVAVRLAGS